MSYEETEDLMPGLSKRDYKKLKTALVALESASV